MRRGIWRTLDLDPTTDRSAIRKAYAARLKAMDVDADPEGFARLREARDAALAGDADEWFEPDYVATIDSVASFAAEPWEAEPEPEPAAAPDPELAAFHDAINAHFQALETLLFPGHDAWPTPEELAAIEHHGRALLADPRMEEIDFATSAERWFAETLSASTPRSDPLLEPAAAVFGWIDRRNDYALSEGAHAIVERIGAIRFAALLSDPKHRLHRAWTELTRPADRRRPWFSSKGAQRELLSLVRSRHPQAESWLEPARVAEAEDTTRPSAGVPVWAIILVIVALLRMCTSGSEHRESPPASPPPVIAVVDPEPVSRDLTGLGLGELTKKNPGLADDVRKTAESLRGEVEQGRVRQAFLDLARWRIQSGIANAPDALLRDIAQFEIDAKQALARSDPIRCDDFEFPAGDQLLTPATAERQATLAHRAMLVSDRRTLTVSGRFRIPGPIVENIQRRTGLSDARLNNALSHKGEHADICRTDIALREAALAQGKAGLTLLRDMQPKVSDQKPTPSE